MPLAAIPVAAIIGAAGIGAAGSIGGALIGAHASGKAADQQMAAADQAAQAVTDATNTVNPTLTQIAANTSAWQAQSADTTSDLLRKAQTDATGAVDTATAQANKLLQPYSDTGAQSNLTLADLTKPGGDLSKPFTAADLQQDPSYAFRLEEGQKALERSAAARGTVLGGGAIKATTRYAQDYASTEYDKAFQRYQEANQQRFSQLSSLANMGLNASTSEGVNLANAGRYTGDTTLSTTGAIADAQQKAIDYASTAYTGAVNQQGQNTINASHTLADILTQKGNAQAAGTVGQANAWAGGLGQATSSISQSLLLAQLLRNPAIDPGQPSAGTIH